MSQLTKRLVLFRRVIERTEGASFTLEASALIDAARVLVVGRVVQELDVVVAELAGLYTARP
jgi:hypothetical protein